jgi:hypothetical protein
MEIEATIWVERGDDELEIKLTADASPRVRGRYHGPPELCYPDEGGEIEDVIATLNGQPFELTKAEADKALEALGEAGREAEAAAYESWEEAKADAWEARQECLD